MKLKRRSRSVCQEGKSESNDSRTPTGMEDDCTHALEGGVHRRDENHKGKKAKTQENKKNQGRRTEMIRWLGMCARRSVSFTAGDFDTTPSF